MLKETENPKKLPLFRNINSSWLIPCRYQLNQLIGTGAYGHVCEAYDLKYKRFVAIKRIYNVFHNIVDSKRILREIAILNRLKHNNIVKIYDICLPTNSIVFNELYIVLELADSDFKKLLKTPVYLSELHIITLLYNLVIGVNYMHSAGIYHRDLKPANCLVNQDCSVKICDFGLARTLSTKNEDDSSIHLQLTCELPEKRQLTGHVASRWYRAPELILLQSSYTEAIDVWSIGCIYAELLDMMHSNETMYLNRTPLFPGRSCFPLSPDFKGGDHSTSFSQKRNHDQLNVMFNIIGTPSEEDMSFIEKSDAKEYLSYFTPRSEINFKERFPGSSSNAIDLLKKMLVFNPSKRITISEILEHPVFKTIRQKHLEYTAFYRVQLPFDDWKLMSVEELRLAFLREIQVYHPSLQIPQKVLSLSSDYLNNRQSDAADITSTKIY